MLCQPSLQVGAAAEIQQRLGQCLQLLQRQTLDAHGDGVAEAAAAAVELTQGDGGCLTSALALSVRKPWPKPTGTHSCC